MSESTMTATPAPAWDYVWFGGQPLAQIEVATGAVRTYFNDHLGTPILQTDAAGTVVWRIEHEPYGEDYAFRAGAELHQPLRDSRDRSGRSGTSSRTTSSGGT
jgi:hypothetical protein